MSVVNRIVLAGALCAAMGAAQASAAERGDDAGSTRGRLFHASKCVVTLGFSGGCDKDQADSRRVEKARPEDGAAVTRVADEHSTRAQFAHASKCVMSFGFIGHCDKNAPDGASRRADAAPAAPDNSTRGRFFQASRCVASFGLVGDCDKK